MNQLQFTVFPEEQPYPLAPRSYDVEERRQRLIAASPETPDDLRRQVLDRWGWSEEEVPRITMAEYYARLIETLFVGVGEVTPERLRQADLEVLSEAHVVFQVRASGLGSERVRRWLSSTSSRQEGA